MSLSKPWRNGVVTVGMYAVVLPFLLPMTTVIDRPIAGLTWLLVVLSSIANTLVLVYHHVVLPHPKFTLLPRRRRVLLVHIVAGSIEFMAGLVACSLGGHAVAGQVMALVALLFHVPTAYLQTPMVLGSRAAVATFLLFNTYVWVRIYFFVLDKFGLFAGTKYTSAVLLAGFTTTPIVLESTTVLDHRAGLGGVYVDAQAVLSTRTERCDRGPAPSRSGVESDRHA